MLSGNIKFVEYGPHEDPLGYVEPAGENPPWIMWYWQDGHADLYLSREPSGAVVGDPIRLPPGHVFQMASK